MTRYYFNQIRFPHYYSNVLSIQTIIQNLRRLDLFFYITDEFIMLISILPLTISLNQSVFDSILVFPLPILPGSRSEEVLRFPIHQFRPKSAHFLFHLPHLGVESLPDIAEFGVYDAEVAQFNGNITPDSFGHLVSVKSLEQVKKIGNNS